MDDLDPPAKRLKISDSTDDTKIQNDDSKALSSSVKIEVVIERSSQSSPNLAELPPTKKKRKAPEPPEERKTEHLNLKTLSTDSKIQKKQLATLFHILNKKKKIVVIAGAGISVGAGIPDFRSATGLFASVKTDYKVKASGKLLFDACVYKDDQSTSSFHDMVRDLKEMSENAEPTAFHHLLASLAASNRLLRLYTQNVDCIETSLEPLATRVPLNNKGPWPKTIQLHGGLDKMVCQKCGFLDNFDRSLFVGSKPPDCSECIKWEQTRDAVGKRSLGIGKLRPRMVLYNEFNPDADAIGAVSHADLKARPDALIVVGTSLKIPGVRRLVREISATIRTNRGGRTIWINEDDAPTGKEFEGIFDLVVKGDCEKVARLANVQQWDMPPIPLGQPMTSTGKQFGLSTPQSLLSECDSPLSSAVSYTSDDDVEFERKLRVDDSSITSVNQFMIPPLALGSTSQVQNPKKIMITKPKTKVKVTTANSTTKPAAKPVSKSSMSSTKGKQKITISKVFKSAKVTLQPSGKPRNGKSSKLVVGKAVKTVQVPQTPKSVSSIPSSSIFHKGNTNTTSTCATEEKVHSPLDGNLQSSPSQHKCSLQFILRPEASGQS